MLRNRRRWLVTSFVLLISAVAYVDRVNLSVAAPILTKQFHTNAAVMGLLLSSFTWTYTLLNIPAGMLVDRVRTRFVYSGGLLIWGLASFLTVLVNSAGALFGPRLLLGVGEAPFIPAAVRTMSDWLPRSERGAGGSVFISGVALGSAVGPPVLAALVSGYGWRSCFVATGVLSLIVAAVWFMWYRHPSEDRRLSDTERELILADQEPVQVTGRAPWRTLVRSRDIWAITSGYFCLLYIQYTFVSWVPSYLVQDRHLTVLKSGFATSIPWTCAFLVAIAGGRISDVLIRRGFSALNARKVVLVGGMVAALAILGTALASSATAAIVFLSISTSGIVLANGAAWAATQDVVHRLNLAGSASGFINGISNIGGLLGPVVTGALVYATSSFVVPLVASAGIALAGALAWQFGIRDRTESASRADDSLTRTRTFTGPRLAYGAAAAVAVLAGVGAVGLTTHSTTRTALGPVPTGTDRPGTPEHSLPGSDLPDTAPVPDPVPWAGPSDPTPFTGPVVTPVTAPPQLARGGPANDGSSAQPVVADYGNTGSEHHDDAGGGHSDGGYHDSGGPGGGHNGGGHNGGGNGGGDHGGGGGHHGGGRPGGGGPGSGGHGGGGPGGGGHHGGGGGPGSGGHHGGGHHGGGGPGSGGHGGGGPGGGGHHGGGGGGHGGGDGGGHSGGGHHGGGGGHHGGGGGHGGGGHGGGHGH